MSRNTTEALALAELRGSGTAVSAFARLASRDVAEAAAMIARCLLDGGQVLACGNGGSAAQAAHLVGEFVGRFRCERLPLCAVDLTACAVTLTAIANDYGYAECFARQVDALGQSGDVLVCLSTSGNSPNVLRAVKAAEGKRMGIVALVGGDGGALAQEVELAVPGVCIVAPSDVTSQVQECHLAALHAICALVDKRMCPE